MSTTSKRDQPLLTWQRANYPTAHQSRRILLLHLVTVPLFMIGTIGAVIGWLISPWLIPVGVAMMAGVMALQGRSHKHEVEPPAPFLGPTDVVARIFAEQWITFPRFFLSGGFARAWSAAPR